LIASRIPYDPAKADALVAAFVESGAALVPTLIVQSPQLRASDPVFNGRRKADDEEFQELPATLLKKWRQVAGTEVLEQPFSDKDRAAMARQYDVLARLLTKMHQAGRADSGRHRRVLSGWHPVDLARLQSA
jgi:hypothetical protein